MFTCANCGKDRPESEERSIGRLAIFGLRTISKPPPPSAPPRRLCKACAFAVSAAGIICAITVAGLIALFGFGVCAGILKQLRNQNDATLTLLSSVIGLVVVYFIFLRRRYL